MDVTLNKQPSRIGFHPKDILIDEPTRNAPLKWVVIVDQGLPPGRAMNAAVCVAAATSAAVTGLLGPDALDRDHSIHAGLPWAGCTILMATSERISAIRAKAAAADDTVIADMPAQAQETRVYAEYLANMSTAETIDYHAISLVGPRNRVSKLVHSLPLLP